MPQKTRSLDRNQRLIGDSILEILADRYGFEDYDVVPFIGIDGEIVALDRRSNTASKAIIREPASGEKYLVKRFPWYMSEESLVEFAATFQSTVAQEYDRVPNIETTRSGDLVTAISDEFYYVQAFVPGGQTYHKRGPSSSAVCRNAGRTLADLHTISEDRMTWSGDHRESVFDLCRGILDILEGEVIEGNEDRFSAAERSAALDYVEYTADRVDELEGEVDGPENVFPVHGDYNPTNLILADDDVSGVVDFDNCCVGRPEHDVAEALVTFSYVDYAGNSSGFREPTDSWERENARALLEGYASSRDVNVDCLPPIAESIALELFTVGLVRNDLPLEMAEDLISCSRNVREHVEDLATVRRW